MPNYQEYIKKLNKKARSKYCPILTASELFDVHVIVEAEIGKTKKGEDKVVLYCYKEPKEGDPKEGDENFEKPELKKVYLSPKYLDKETFKMIKECSEAKFETFKFKCDAIDESSEYSIPTYSFDIDMKNKRQFYND
ncbi:unnamed protein product [Chironomus riparius]|uniref:Uncharacterized protein n=1 Tax=Chironomus riparius TaxID=315576 RepID=A0A9N9S1C7_9DIPT|nr:unnamed protein product [Chironomus riparius]